MQRAGQKWLAASRLRSARPCQTRLSSTKVDDISTRQLIRRYLSVPILSKPPFSPPVRWLVYGVSTSLGLHIFTSYFYAFDATWGISMLPTLASFGDWVVISKYYRRGREVRVGDMVSFAHPVRVDEFAVKRVIGLEGDFVLMNTPEKSETMIQVPQGHCWVTGDNLEHSRDSRMFGPLPMALIKGKVIAKASFQKGRREFAWIGEGLQPGHTDNYDLD